MYTRDGIMYRQPERDSVQTGGTVQKGLTIFLLVCTSKAFRMTVSMSVSRIVSFRVKAKTKDS